ncbi:ABC transporter substrate-binding protein [Vibrio sp. DW001]|uniref:ABC transporter substrate-binding protein n=1 Tax=Vibrio sp. DW001 TaxID=2912315 RepID=UPI0023AFA49F|nr:ABC transporter substrate-binding protein [Vibrio sp. DW001]WED28878.1 ABC transporter substrate-binding protein [Vibrio sp. DW001]
MLRCLLILLALVSVPEALAYERIVLLAPAAGDILIRLGVQDKVVGVTRSNDDFPNALKVGSHIKPNVELLKGLKPDLLIISSNRFFSEYMSQQLDVEVMKYDPVTLDQILTQITSLGERVNRPSEANKLVQELVHVREQIQPLKQRPRVVFEVTESPFMVAGDKSIVNGIIGAAGGDLIAPTGRKVAKFNIESILIEDPDYYIYQIGPMNKRPTLPSNRPNYSILSSKFMQVDQLEFSRANTRSFYLSLELNHRFNTQQ